VIRWLGTFSSFGWSGGDLFFVLSGYLIADKLFRGFASQGRIDLAGFYLNRFFRIIAAYLAVVAVYFIFPNLQEGRGLQPLWRFLTFTQNISIDMYRNTFSHAWSLCVEEHFYLLLPILLGLTFSRKKTNMALSILYLIVEKPFLIMRYKLKTC
jgi:peptidoglycan/LPS O-acetylase OafA/YrhL